MIKQTSMLQRYCGGPRRTLFLFMAIALIVGYQIILLHKYKIYVNSIICVKQNTELDGEEQNMEFIVNNEGMHYLEHSVLANQEAQNSYHTELKGLTELLDVKASRRNIFFIESSCSLKQVANERLPSTGCELNARQACSVESAARSNPSHNVYILYTCSLNPDYYSQSTPVVQKMLSYHNIFLVTINMSEYLRHTPVEYLYSSNKLQKSKFPVEHTSDMLRMVTLWKYGGTYMDLDVIVTRELDDLGYNYGGYGWSALDGRIANAVMNFASEGVGHELIQLCLQQLNRTFNGSTYTHNGPELFTKVLTEKCGVGKLTKDNCGFTAYPPTTFFPVNYSSYVSLFLPQDDEFMAKFDRAYTVHFWNNLSRQMKVTVDGGTPYDLLAERNCPNVHADCGDTM